MFGQDLSRQIAFSKRLQSMEPQERECFFKTLWDRAVELGLAPKEPRVFNNCNDLEQMSMFDEQ